MFFKIFDFEQEDFELSKGLKLEQFKEPAFSSDILRLNSEKFYISSVCNADISEKIEESKKIQETKDDRENQKINAISEKRQEKNKNKFKFLFSANDEIKKNDIIAYRLIDNQKYSSVNIYAHSACVVSESKYLMTDKEEPALFVVLNNSEQQKQEDNKKNNNISNNISKEKTILFSENYDKTVDDLIELTHKASIIDETDGIYLFEKFQKLITNKINSENKKNQKKKIYIDAIDDQPYTSSKESLLLSFPNEINFAIDVVKKVFGLQNLDIILYDIEDYNRERKIFKKNFNSNVISFKGNYPARHYISKKYSYDGSIGVQALLHFARAMLDNSYRQTTTFVTVAGDSVSEPRNVEIPIGTPVGEIASFFDFKKEVKRIVLGQVMTGYAISDVEFPISATTRSVLFFSDYVVYKQLECIGCARCNSVCPQNLLPCYRHKYQETNDDSYKNFSFDENCIKCQCCSYICPSHIKLV